MLKPQSGLAKQVSKAVLPLTGKPRRGINIEAINNPRQGKDNRSCFARGYVMSEAKLHMAEGHMLTALAPAKGAKAASPSFAFDLNFFLFM